MQFYLDGKAYELEDMELGDLEYLEEELGDLDDPQVMRSMKAAVRIVYVIKRQQEPDFTLEDARKLKLTVFDEPQNGNGNGNGNGHGGPPQKAARKKAARTTPAGSGASS